MDRDAVEAVAPSPHEATIMYPPAPPSGCVSAVICDLEQARPPGHRALRRCMPPPGVLRARPGTAKIQRRQCQGLLWLVRCNTCCHALASLILQAVQSVANCTSMRAHGSMCCSA